MPAPPDFPPLLTGHPVAADEDPLRVALEGAESGRLGAGDLCWSEAETHAAAAIVLEPEGSLEEALQMAPLLMVAIGDALGAIGPPNLAVMYRWPFTLLANGGEVGHVFLRAPQRASLVEVPDYIVLGFSIALSLPAATMAAPGLSANTTALCEEGCGDLDRSQVIAAVARHFLSWVDSWQQDGFRVAHADFWGRMPGAGDVVTIGVGAATHQGQMIGIDKDGGLLLEVADGVRGIPLALALGIGE